MEGVEGVEFEATAALVVPLSCSARAANAADERAELSSEFIESTIPTIHISNDGAIVPEFARTGTTMRFGVGF